MEGGGLMLNKYQIAWNAIAMLHFKMEELKEKEGGTI